VSRDNFGERVSLLAAAALVVDYTLTVAVSIAAGTAALTSAFPRLIPATVPLCLALLAVITVLNLRGLGNAARAFLLLTMVFIVGLLAIIAIGLVHPLAPHAGPVGWLLLPVRALAPAGLVLVLKAFSAGCSALTGTEAIANGVPLFKPPRVRRAKRTELLPRRDPGRDAAGPGGAGQPLARLLSYTSDAILPQSTASRSSGRPIPLWQLPP
jgi:amino acid transporter